jgi:hypothetical protein
MKSPFAKIDTDRILSVCAILIGVATFGVYFVQTRLLLSQQHASVWPCIELSGDNGSLKNSSSTGYFRVNVANKGIGPAIIKKVEIIHKGKAYKTFGDLFEATTGNNNYTNSSLEGRTLSAGETIHPIGVGESKEGLLFTNVFYNSTIFRVYYQSVYGKCFVSEGFATKELPDCEGF